MSSWSGPTRSAANRIVCWRRRPNVHLLGARPYEDVPAYLQHADVVIVPHRVSPFTESLDPIKAYECLAIDDADRGYARRGLPGAC